MGEDPEDRRTRDERPQRRLRVEQAVRYSLEHYTIAFASLVPFASFGWTLYTHRHEPIGSVLSGFDLWSLAVVLFESVTGQLPPADIRELGSSCPAEVADFFKQCLAPRRRQRPSTAPQMKGQLLALVRATQAA